MLLTGEVNVMIPEPRPVLDKSLMTTAGTICNHFPVTLLRANMVTNTVTHTGDQKHALQAVTTAT